MELALFYHDAVNTGDDTDEAASCRMMRRRVFDRELSENAANLIGATAHRQCQNDMTPDMNIISDLDLAILGDTFNYGIYAANIRLHYKYRLKSTDLYREVNAKLRYQFNPRVENL